MSDTIRVVARLTASPEKADALKAACLAVLPPTRAETGCLRYDLLQNRADPTDFTFVEEWTTEEALNAHSKTPHIAALLKAAGPCLAGPPDIRRYRQVG